MAEMKLAELAHLIEGEIFGDGSIIIRGVAGISEAGPGDLSFIHSPKYVSAIADCKASALIVSHDLDTDFRPLIRVANPYQAFAKAIGLLAGNLQQRIPGIHPTATIAVSARIAEDVCIGAHVVIDEGASLGRGTVLCPGVYVGPLCHIGENALIYPNVAINTQSVIGDNVILHSGTIIGSAMEPITMLGASEEAIPKVIIEDDVELGANCTVCLGSPATIIKHGTKLDNLVNVGPGACIEEECIIVAQVLLGAGVTIGRRATIAGQVAVHDKVKVGANSMVAAKSTVTKDVPPNSVVSGAPALPHELDMRLEAYMKRLPRIFERVHVIENRIFGNRGAGNA